MQGLLRAFIGSFDPFGIYDSFMAQAFFHGSLLSAEAQKVFSFVLAPFGATIAGYFVLQYCITIHEFALKQKWAYQAITFAFMLWFCSRYVFELISPGLF
jgi:hypothetical protein